MPTLEETKSTQEFVIIDVLVKHCGEMLTPDKVDEIRKEIIDEMRKGPCSWAFDC